MRSRIVLAAAVVVLLVGGGLAAAWVITREEAPPPVIRGSPTVEFETDSEPAPPTETETPPVEPVREAWPTYGYDVARRHVAPAEYKHRPPFRQRWRFRIGGAAEFPPTVAYGRVYVTQTYGRVIALDARTGKVVWRRRLEGRCAAASPTVTGGIVYQTFLPSPCFYGNRGGAGLLAAFDADTGKDVWRFKGPGSETTALVVKRKVYFGGWDHRLYALDAKRGKLLWRFTADDELNGSPAYAYGTIFIGSDGGRLFAVDAKSGKQRWRAEALRREYFYASPAVAYGRVFIGNTDGTVYAFGAHTGHLLWTQRAGTYVYTAAAVWNKTVYVGSYDGNFYALDAGTGDRRWTFNSPAAIHGAPTVMDGLVYFSTCGTCGRQGSRYAEGGPDVTIALNARTGRQVWRFPDGRYSPIVADEERVYLAGKDHIYGLEPRS